MPLVTIEGPPLKDIDTKRILAKEITDSMTNAYGMRSEFITILFHENEPDMVSVGGELICDRHDREADGSG